MIKTYKHKTLGWIAECLETNERVCIGSGPMLGIWCSVEEVLSLGFEEVVEKDRIDEVIEKFDGGVNRLSVASRYELRTLLAQHAPKQKKFTREEIIEYHTGAIDLEGQRRIYRHDINPLLKFLGDHNLLSSDE